MRTSFSSLAAFVSMIVLAGFALCQQAAAAPMDFYEYTVLNTGAGPQVYWRLGESSIASPADNLGTSAATDDGTYGSSTVVGVAGAIANSTNTAASFSNAGSVTTSFVRKSAFSFPTTDFSAEVWVKTSTAGRTQGWVSYNAPGGENNFLLFNDPSDKINLILSNTPTQVTTLGINDGQWHHIVTNWQKSNGKLDIYNNGALGFSALGIATGVGRIVGGDLVLAQEQDGTGASGSYTFDFTQALTGQLDEFAIYGFLLTPAQILEHYQAGIGLIGFPVPEPSSMLLLGLGMVGLVRHTRKRNRKS